VRRKEGGKKEARRGGEKETRRGGGEGGVYRAARA